MWRSKKFILTLALAIIALVGGTTGVVMAASGDDGTETQHQALLDRICAIYEENTGVAIDSEQLQSAFNQAREEMREQALEEKLAALVEGGKITQEEADQFLEWWQARPDIELQGVMGGLMDGPMGHHYRGGMMGGGNFWGVGPYCGDTSGDTDDGTTA
jgi:hypothetical protein